MKNAEIIKRAQKQCGEYVTGYKGDITIETLNVICEAMWSRAVNLSMNFTEWLGEVLQVIGKKNFEFWFDEIQGFKQKKIDQQKFFVFHDKWFCA